MRYRSILFVTRLARTCLWEKNHPRWAIIGRWNGPCLCWPRYRWVIAVVCLMSFAYNVSRWFEYRPGLVQMPDPDAVNGTRQDIGPVLTPIGKNDTYQRVYFSWLYLPVMCIAPLAALTVINTSLFLAVRRSRADRKQMNVRQSRENNVTLVLVAVVAVFIICQVTSLGGARQHGINVRR